MESLIPFLLTLSGYLREVLASLVLVMAVTLLPIVFCCLILYTMARLANRGVIHAFGWNGLLFHAWLGTPIHELSHMIPLIVTGHRIEKVALFSPNEQTGDLGYVSHSYDPRNIMHILGNFLSSMAPFFGGAFTLFVVTRLFLPEFTFPTLATKEIPLFSLSLLENPTLIPHFFQALIQYQLLLAGEIAKVLQWTDWRTYLYLYTTMCVGFHLSPSRSDLKNLMEAFWVLFGILFATNLILYGLRAGITDYGGLLDGIYMIEGKLVALLYLAVLLTAGTAAMALIISAGAALVRRRF
ncbi:MAG: hypothetical protein HYX88_04365 [Chloroflexi bacterium]|nr:hypothetical protein [Chloroflexota bacterium]